MKVPYAVAALLAPAYSTRYYRNKYGYDFLKDYDNHKYDNTPE